jgi:hypothetical protein
MPTKIEIKANKAEAKQLRKQLAAKERANLKACKAARWTIRKAAAQILKLESSQSLFAAKVNKRLAILEGRNNA